MEGINMKYFALVFILSLSFTACGSVKKYEISVSEYACQEEGGVLKIQPADVFLPFSVECESGKRFLGNSELRSRYIESLKSGGLISEKPGH